MKFKITIQTPRGMHDLIKEDGDFFISLNYEIIKLSKLYGFEYIRTPIVEDEKVFTSSLGISTDVIEKEMFYIKDKTAKYVLRPEGTASIARAYLQNGMHSWSQPVKLFYIGPMYRKERPQAGRYREHYQWGLEILGSEDPICDVEIIQTIDTFFKKFKLKDYIFKVNSLGCLNDRKRYKKDLKKYYRKYLKNLCKNCKKRYKINPLRLLDCKEHNDQVYKKSAPILIDYLCKDCENHFQRFLEYLEILNINYELDNYLVRGFDYYSKTVFEIFFTESPIAIGGGGRYDYLIKMLGGKQIPGVGGAIGIERLTDILKIHQVNLRFFKKPEVFVAQTTEKAKESALLIYDLFIKNKIRAASNFSKTSLSSQLEIANKIGVKYCIIIGHQEIGGKSVIVKDMESGIQETIPVQQLIQEMKKRLG